MGIRGKLALLVPGLLALTVAGVSLGVTEVQRREQLAEMRLRHQLVLEAVGVTAAVYVAQNDMAGLDALVANVGQTRLDPDLVELAVLNQEGRIVAHSDPTRFNERVEDPFVQAALVAEEPLARGADGLLRVAVPARAGVRWATIIGTYSLERVEEAVARSRTGWFLGAAILALLLSLVLLASMYRLVVRPVRALQRVARQMGEGDLDARAPALGTGELGELSETFNRMAEALQMQHVHLEAAVDARTRELSEANARLETLAVTDGLTGVFNHRRFQEALAQETLRSGRNESPFSVLMVDVDHFKRFNDTLGHPAGDELLRKLAAILRRELRQTDFLARYGGEEFAAILPDTGKEVAAQAAERLRSAVEQELNPDPAHPRVTISVGSATFAADGVEPHALLIAADKALYTAKHSGRNKVIAAHEVLEKTG